MKNMFTETVIHLWLLHSEFSSKSLLRQVFQLTVFLGNFDEQTTKAKILCSFCFHSKLFITRKISQLLQLLLPATISAYKVNYMNQSLIQDLDLGSNMSIIGASQMSKNIPDTSPFKRGMLSQVHIPSQMQKHLEVW